VKRGDLVTVAVSGDYGKPRPALVIQADAFSELGSVTVLRLTSELHDWPSFRVTVEATEANGLRATSQIMIDKAAAVPREKIGRAFGHLDAATMRAVNRALVTFLDLDWAGA
jgi:mRNA interferase MazF